MNKEEIISVLKDLYKISGFRVSLHGVNYEEIAAYPKEKLAFCSYIQNRGVDELEKCKACDKNACQKALSTGDTVIYRCRHGLIDAISPLYSFGSLTGYMIMGQVREKGIDIEPMINVLRSIGLNSKDSTNMCLSIPEVDSQLIRSFVKVSTICGKYLTMSNAFIGDKLTLGQSIMKYINENYVSHIKISDICDAMGYSKSTVLSAFKKEYGTTINAYLNDTRLNTAKKLLDEGEMTINQIATATGFADQSYFSKVFSAKFGVSPSDYRKDDKNENNTHL